MHHRSCFKKYSGHSAGRSDQIFFCMIISKNSSACLRKLFCRLIQRFSTHCKTKKKISKQMYGDQKKKNYKVDILNQSFQRSCLSVKQTHFYAGILEHVLCQLIGINIGDVNCTDFGIDDHLGADHTGLIGAIEYTTSD